MPLEYFLKKARQDGWPSVMRYNHGLFPRIYKNLMGSPEKQRVPGDVREKLMHLYASSLNANINKRKEITGLARAFARENIKLIFLKGAALMATVYRDDIAVRAMTDIDVLVRTRDIRKAREIISRRGYQEDKQLDPEHFHRVYYNNGIRLELHRDIAYESGPIVLKKLLDSSEKVTFERTQVTVLSPEGSVLMTCLDFLKDFTELYHHWWSESKDARDKVFFHGLFSLYDLKDELEFYGRRFSWNTFLSLADSLPYTHEIHLLLFLARKVAGANVAEEVITTGEKTWWVKTYIRLSRNIAADNIVDLLLLRDLMRVARDYRFSLKKLFSSIAEIYRILKRAIFLFYPRFYFVAGKITRPIRKLIGRCRLLLR